MIKSFKKYDNPVVSSGKTNDDIRIFVQHCDKGQRTNAKSNAKLHPIVPMPNVWHLVCSLHVEVNV